MASIQSGKIKKFWTGKNVLITGVAGFVGSRLAEFFTNFQTNIIGLVRDLNEINNLKLFNLDNKINIVIGDLLDRDFIFRILTKYNVDTVYHLAAQVVVSIANENPISTFESNIKGTYQLLEAIRNYSKVERIVIASSDKAYGIHKKLPYKEDYPLLPHYPYDVSKACADMIARSYYFTYNMPVVITRFANLYGPGQLHFSAIIPDTIMSILNNRNPVIRSDGTPERDFLFINDAITVYELLGRNLQRKKLSGEIFNAGNCKSIKIIDLVNIILKVQNSQLKPLAKGRKKPRHEIDRQFLDASKIRNKLGFSPKYSLEDGLKETYLWYKKKFSRLNKVYLRKFR